MTYLVDAWLERPNPYLRILDRETGNVCISLDEEALLQMQEQGELSPADLLTNEPGKLKELIRQLFLFCYARALQPTTRA